MKMAETNQSKIPECRAPSEETKSGDVDDVSEEVCPYYHPMAIDLYDKFEDGGKSVVDNYISEIDQFYLEYALDSLGDLEQLQKDSHEYFCSSQLNVILDRFFFHLKKRMKKGALLPQYPVYQTRRSDGSLYAYGDRHPVHGILHYDYEPYLLAKAIHESVCYFISSLMATKKYGWAFGLPCTCTDMVFMLYMSGNSKSYSIEIARVKLSDRESLKFFLTIVYAAVHYSIDNQETLRSVPFGCKPNEDIELRDQFHNHASQRVFMHYRKVYKFYKNGDPKSHNYKLMKDLGYFENLELKKIGRNFTVLIYTIIEGSTVPLSYKHIAMAKVSISRLHSLGLVHGDIRRGNIVFTDNDALLIDFDFTGECGSTYPTSYNCSLSERHPSVEKGGKLDYCHDYYALMMIAQAQFPHCTWDEHDPCLSCLCPHCSKQSD